MEKYFSPDVLGSGGYEHPPVSKFNRNHTLIFFPLTILCIISAYISKRQNRSLEYLGL